MIDDLTTSFKSIYKDASLNFPSSVKAHLLCAHLKDCLRIIEGLFDSPLGLGAFTDAKVCNFQLFIPSYIIHDFLNFLNRSRRSMQIFLN